MTADHGQTEGIGQDTAHCDTGDLLVRRSPGSGELAFYLCWSPRAAPLAELVKVAGARRPVDNFPARRRPGVAGRSPEATDRQ
jgi:hypothetical protein